MPRRPHWAVVALVAVVFLGVLVVSAVPDRDAVHKTFIVAGTVRLSGQPALVLGQPCAGVGDAADLHDGAGVVVYGEHGETLGRGELIDGAGTADGAAVVCVWTFFVSGVDAGGDVYFVEVTQRGRQRYDTSGIHGRVDFSF